MIEFPLYKIYDEHDNEILVEDPDLLKELVVHLLEDNNEITIRKESKVTVYKITKGDHIGIHRK